MKRSSITLPEPLAEALAAYIHDQDAHPTLTAVVQAALAQYLAQRGYLPPHGLGLRITPAERGSGRHDTSTRHDAALAEPDAGSVT